MLLWHCSKFINMVKPKPQLTSESKKKRAHNIQDKLFLTHGQIMKKIFSFIFYNNNNNQNILFVIHKKHTDIKLKNRRENYQSYSIIIPRK